MWPRAIPPVVLHDAGGRELAAIDGSGAVRWQHVIIAQVQRRGRQVTVRDRGVLIGAARIGLLGGSAPVIEVERVRARIRGGFIDVAELGDLIVRAISDGRVDDITGATIGRISPAPSSCTWTAAILLALAVSRWSALVPIVPWQWTPAVRPASLSWRMGAGEHVMGRFLRWYGQLPDQHRREVAATAPGGDRPGDWRSWLAEVSSEPGS
jgi:hypothetical protein